MRHRFYYLLLLTLLFAGCQSVEIIKPLWISQGVPSTDKTHYEIISFSPDQENSPGKILYKSLMEKNYFISESLDTESYKDWIQNLRENTLKLDSSNPEILPFKIEKEWISQEENIHYFLVSADKKMIETEYEILKRNFNTVMGKISERENKLLLYQASGSLIDALEEIRALFYDIASSDLLYKERLLEKYGNSYIEVWKQIRIDFSDEENYEFQIIDSLTKTRQKGFHITLEPEFYYSEKEGLYTIFPDETVRINGQSLEISIQVDRISELEDELSSTINNEIANIGTLSINHFLEPVVTQKDIWTLLQISDFDAAGNELKKITEKSFEETLRENGFKVYRSDDIREKTDSGFSRVIRGNAEIISFSKSDFYNIKVRGSLALFNKDSKNDLWKITLEKSAIGYSAEQAVTTAFSQLGRVLARRMMDVFP